MTETSPAGPYRRRIHALLERQAALCSLRELPADPDEMDYLREALTVYHHLEKCGKRHSDMIHADGRGKPFCEELVF